MSRPARESTGRASGASGRGVLGASGIEVSRLCLGGNVFGWSADEAASFAVLDAYLDSGGDFVDTANIYSGWVPGNRGGESEAIIGRWLRSRGVRDRVVIATKVGMAGGDFPKGLTRDHVRRGVEGSLARLGVDAVDLYLAHEDDPATPLAETAAAFDELVREGLIRAVGVSNLDARRLDEWMAVCAEHGLTAPSVLQPHYNLLDRDGFEGPLARVATRHGLAVTPYFAIARGFLSGKYRRGEAVPSGARAPGVARDYLNDRGFAVLAAVEEVAGARGATPAQVALAWLLTRPGVVAPIASATRPEQVRELMGALGVELTPEDTARLDSAGGEDPTPEGPLRRPARP